MRKKIALISVHSDPNFGSMLQAYALARVVKSLGHDCEYINYKHYIERPYIVRFVINLIKKAKSIVKGTESISFIDSKEYRAQRKLFCEFHDQHIPSSSKWYNPANIKKANSEYDYFMVGSDQTWSPLVTDLPNTIDFLDFVEDDSKKLSYAPSIGTTHIPEDYLSILIQKLSKFKSLSCRERANSNFLSGVLGREVTHVLDPTLLLTKEQWMEIAEDIDMPDNYILCYILGEKQCISDFAERLGREKSMPVYYIVTRPLYLQKENNLPAVSIGQFLTLINNAAYVVTDSFHGSIFSVNFGKNFYSFSKREDDGTTNDNDRIMDVLDTFNLVKRYKDRIDLKSEENIVYSVIHLTLSELRKNSTDYLNQIIN